MFLLSDLFRDYLIVFLQDSFIALGLLFAFGYRAPLTGASQPLQTAQGGAGGNSTSRKDATTNYEVDKTVRVTRNATGSVRRINAAVVVNHRTNTDAKGKTTTVPLTPDELQKLETMVREIVGYNEKRGDSVKVINAPFKPETVLVDNTPFWKQPQMLDLLRSAAMPAALAIVALAIVFGLIRPALKQAQVDKEVAKGQNLDAVVADDETLPVLQPVHVPTQIEGPRVSAHLAVDRAGEPPPRCGSGHAAALGGRGSDRRLHDPRRPPSVRTRRGGPTRGRPTTRHATPGQHGRHA